MSVFWSPIITTLLTYRKHNMAKTRKDMRVATGQIVRLTRRVGTKNTAELAHWDETVLFPGDLPKAIVRALTGKKVGDLLEVTSNEFNHHPVNAGNTAYVPLTKLQHPNPQRGSVLRTVAGTKTLFARVLEVGNEEALLDISIPEAGSESVHYQVEILEIRSPTPDELHAWSPKRELVKKQ
jgi:FKBP-type peptidyl-prolyl cis-trans isomerase 2